jgi:hypothetical protein
MISREQKALEELRIILRISEVVAGSKVESREGICKGE